MWLLLIGVSLLFGCFLFWLAVPAAFFVAAMLCGLAFSLVGRQLVLPRPLFLLAQALIGGSVARYMTADVLRTLADHWLVMGAMVSSTILAGGLVGLFLKKSGIIPGATAAWGSSPGGASVMVSMAEAYGADIRMVALMQYLRVFLVVLTTSTVAHYLLAPARIPDLSNGIASLWHFTGSPDQLALTLVITIVCAWLAWRLHMPAGPILLCMLVGAVLNASGLVDFRLSAPVQVGASMLLGWCVGLGFNRALLTSALRMMHWLFFSAFLLIVLCAAFSWMLHHFTACDALTAYLATTPGGLDAVLLLTVDSQADIPFVAATQTLRLFLVVLTGPIIARGICRLA